MGSNHSLHRKDMDRFGVTNLTTNEKLLNKIYVNNNEKYKTERVGKENVLQTNNDIQLATAYLQKYACVSKRTMKTIMRPNVTSKNIKNNSMQNLEPNNITTEQATTDPALPAKCEKVQKLTLPSSSNAIKCLGAFICSRYLHSLPHLTANEVILWLKNVDRALTLSGWQDHGFLNVPNITFLYLIAKEYLRENTTSVHQLRAELLTVLYMAYTYTGPEISYPLKPFLVDKNRTAFWNRCCFITNNLSGAMLKIHKDTKFYDEIQAELATYGCFLQRQRSAKRA